MSYKINFKGIAYPKGDPKGTNNIHPAVDEYPKIINSLKGKPILFEHDENHPLGYIEHAELDVNGNIIIHAYIDKTKPLAATVIKEIREKKRNGLSLGKVDGIDLNQKGKITQRSIKEVSIVGVPYFENTYITEIEDDKPIDKKIDHLFDRLFKQSFNNINTFDNNLYKKSNYIFL